MKEYQVPGMGPVYRLEAGDDARGVEALLRSELAIAYDTEGSHLSVYAADFDHRLSQFGTTDLAFTWDPDELSLDRLVTTTRPVWYWNADYDTRVIARKRGIELHETWPFVMDAQILSRLIDPRGVKDGGIGHSMDEQAQERLGLEVKGQAKRAMMEAGKAYKLRSAAAVWANIPRTDEAYNVYAGQDVMLTTRLGLHLLQGIAYYDMEEIASKQHAVAYCYSDIVHRGFKIDRAYGEAAVAKYRSIFEAEEAELAKLGVRPTATGNYATSRAGLIDKFGEHGVKFSTFTDSGAPKLDDKVLKSIADKKDDAAAEIARRVVAAKKAQKVAITIQGYLDAADENDRVHGNLLPLGTQTGRTASSNPNVQNVDKDAPESRGTFVGDTEEEDVISSDLKSIEWRVAAIVTGDENLRNEYINGTGDIHSKTAELFYGARFRNADAETRQKLRDGGKIGGEVLPSMKVASLAKLYGSGVEGQARTSGLDEEVVQRVYDAIDTAYPGIKAHMSAAYDEIDGPTRVELRSGRVAIVDRPYKKLNAECQGYAADLLYDAVLRIYAAGLGHTIRCVVHDELLFSYPRAGAEEFMEKIRGLMETEIEGIPILTDPKSCGPRWRKV